MKEDREIKNNCMSKMRSMIVLGLVISVLVIGIRVIVLIFGGPPKETVVDYFETIDDAVKNILIPLLGIGVTAVLSYMIWEANSKSALVAEKMGERERELEKEKIILSASKIFFSMLSAYEYLQYHYMDESNNRTVYICQDWLDEISKLKKILTKTEIRSIFNLFRDIIALENMENHQEYQSTLDKYCRYRLVYYIKDYEFLAHFTIDDYVKKEDYIIMHKLMRLSDIKSVEEIDEIKDVSNKRKSGKKYVNGQQKILFNFTQKDEYNIQVFSDDGIILMDGVSKNGKFTGYRQAYKWSKLKEKGMYVDGELIKGERYHVFYRSNYEAPEPEENYCSNLIEYYYKIVQVEDGVEIRNSDSTNIQEVMF